MPDASRRPARNTGNQADLNGAEQHARPFAWVVLFFAFGVYTLTFIDRLAWGSLAARAGTSLGMSVASLEVFVTAFYGTYVLSNAAGGYLIDWFGPRLMVLLGLVPLGVLTFLFSYTPSVWVGIVLQAGMGATAGIDYTACVKLVASWFPLRTRGKAMGLFLVGSSLGIFLTNAILPGFSTYVGWRGSYRYIGMATILWGILAYLVVRDGPSKPAHTSKPDYRPLYRNRNLLFLALSGFGLFWGIVGFTNWASALMVKGYHIPLVRAGLVVALFGIGTMVGKPVMGFITDHFSGHYKWVSVFCMASFAVMLLLFGRLTTETMFLIIAPLVGITCQWAVPVMATLITEEATVGLTGTATGLTNAVWQLSGAAVPLAVGGVFQATRSFDAAFGLLAAGPVFGILMLLFVRERARKAPIG